MTTISILRKTTTADKARVKQAAIRFCKRHNINVSDDAEISIQFAITNANPAERPRLRRLWMACYCRALQVPYNSRTIVQGEYIGIRCK